MTNVVDLSYGHTDAKEHQNLEALTAEGEVKRVIYGSGTWNPASIGSGAEAATDLTVTGVEVGDIVLGASLGVDVSDLVLDAQVTAADTVTLVLANNTGGAVDLGSSTARVLVADVT